ncbi:MAG: enolase C-terminal domain-like protein [Acidobacteriota bacterium]
MNPKFATPDENLHCKGQTRREFVRTSAGLVAVTQSLRLSRASQNIRKVKVLEARVDFMDRSLVKPLQLSSGLISEVTEARVRVRVSVAGREAVGRGAIYLSDLWAWPDPTRSHKEKDAVLKGLCQDFAQRLPALCGGEPEHPLELGLRLHEAVRLVDAPPVLARILCASPFDAAIHDAAGLALNQSAFEFYSKPDPVPAADGWFPQEGACRAIQSVLRSPVRKLDAWWVVGARDSLVDDVAPQVRRGYRSFKLKLLGKDNAADVSRTVEVYRALRRMGLKGPRLSLDSNEANPSADSVLDFLNRLRSGDSEAFDAVQYLEQPTSRDIGRQAFDWRGVNRLKPVLLDEGLTSAESFEIAVQQGWSGFAVKTCKGHSFSLVAAAWALKRRLLLALQDLTNPGLAAIHAALFAAHIPTINGVELNSPQYTPEANREWLPRLSPLLEPRRGVHRLNFDIPAGLGSSL